MARWRFSLLISFMVMILAGSGFAEDNLVADSPWACFFNHRVEKVEPETGELVVKEDGELGSTFSYAGDLITKIQYPTGAYSEYSYVDGKVSIQSLYDEAGKLVVANHYTYTGTETTIYTRDAQLPRRQVKLTFNGSEVVAKDVYDLAYSFTDPIEKWQLRGGSLEIVARKQYLGDTDTFFEATAWDDLLLEFYNPTPSARKERQGVVSFQGNIANIIYTDGLGEQLLEKEFDGLGRLRKLSEEGTVANFEYNWLGLLSKLTIRTDGKEEIVNYKYDALGRPVSDSKARRFEVTYTYFNNKLTEIKSANGIVTYNYTDGILTSREDSMGKRTNYAFDPQKLELSASYEDGSSVSVQYTADGKRSLMKDDSGQTLYEYNEYGQVVKLARGISGESFVLTHEYAPSGWLATVETPNGEKTKITAGENILAQAKKLTTEPIWPWFN